MIKRTLISVYDKSGLEKLAGYLKQIGVEIVSSGGTYDFLNRLRLSATKVSEITRSPEILGGRVKTLHPAIHAGILAREDQLVELSGHGLSAFDLVVVNLYPFQEVVDSGAPLDEALENIDIGGPAMIRAAAKNFPRVTAICSPDDYDPLLKELQSNSGETTLDFRRTMAQKAFSTISGYDQAISAYLVGKEQSFGDTITLKLDKAFRLRYGENPHQQAAL